MQYWRRNLYVSLVMIFIITSSFTMVTPFMPFFLESMNVEGGVATWSGLASGAMFFTSAIMAPVWGSLADRQGKKLQILRSGIGFGLMYALYPLARTPLQFVIMRAVSGMFGGFLPATTSLLASNTPEEHITYSLGLFQATSAAGGICGPLIGGFLVQLGGVTTAFRLGALGIFLITVIPYFIFKEDPVEIREEKPSILQDIKVCFTNKQLVVVFATLLLVQAGINVTQPTLSLYVSGIVGGGSDAVLLSGVVFSVAGIGTVLGAAGAGRAGKADDLTSRLKLLQVGLLGAAIFSALQGVWQVFWVLALLRAIGGLFHGVIQVAANVLVATAVTRDFRGRAFGVQSAINPVGSMAGPIIGGFVGDNYGLSNSFFASGFVLLSSVGLLRWYMKRIQNVVQEDI